MMYMYTEHRNALYAQSDAIKLNRNKLDRTIIKTSLQQTPVHQVIYI